MKKLLFFLAFGFLQLTNAQNLAVVDLYVLDAFGNPEPNFNLVVYDFGSSTGTTLTMITNANGRAIDSMAIGTQGQLYCDININGCLDTAQLFYNPSNGPVVFFTDTLYTCNTSSNCNFNISASRTYPNDPNYQGHYSFTSTHPVNPNSTYLWSFGDGNTAQSISPNHTYAQAGTYVYCLQIDSCPVVCDTVVVTNTSACGGYIYNKPTYYDSTLTFSFGHTHLSNPNTTFSWDFGDGNSSSQTDPNHTYTQPGTYYYCLTIDSCSPICDTIVVFNKKPVTVSGFIYDNSGSPMPLHPFNFNLRYFYGSTLSTSYLIGFWNVLHPNLVADNNGFFTETIYTKVDPSMDSSSVEVQIFDTCSVITTHGPQHFIPANTNAITFVDTFSTSCNTVIPNCNFAFGASVSQINNQTFGFWHQANAMNTFWDFGDGNTSNQASPTHTYNTPGTYVYCVTVDSCPPVCDTVVVQGTSGAVNNFQISALVLTNNYQNIVPNYPVTVIDSALGSSGSTGAVASYNFMTDGTGQFTDSITTVGSSGTLWFLAPDSCGFTRIALGYSTNSPSTLATAGLVLCNNIIPGSNCIFSFGATPSMSNPNLFNFYHQANSTITFWDFGDGSTSTQANPSHTYAAPGTYVYCVTVDSCPPVCDTIVIVSPTNCNASFIIDTVNSQPGNVVVWNTSTPAFSPNSMMQYVWDFGDGNTSMQPFPTHNYNGAGTYTLCLAINIPATATSQACSSLYCDTLKVDSLGNIIQKSTGAIIKLNVLDPNTISIEEEEINSLKIYPNPASDFINIELDANSDGEMSIELIHMNGALIQSSTRDLDFGINTIELDVSRLATGIYFVKMSKDGVNYFEKLNIR